MALNSSTTVYESPRAKTKGANGGYHAATLTGNLTLDASYPALLKLDPGGASRDVTLDNPPSDVTLIREIVNSADAAENLVVKDSSPATIGTINQNEAGRFYWSGTAWSLINIVTIALS